MACLFFWCLFVLQVSTADQRRSSPKTMVSCNKKSLYLPPEMPAIHVEFTEYYFPDGKDYPSKTNVFYRIIILCLVGHRLSVCSHTAYRAHCFGRGLVSLQSFGWIQFSFSAVGKSLTNVRLREHQFLNYTQCSY